MITWLRWLRLMYKRKYPVDTTHYSPFNIYSVLMLTELKMLFSSLKLFSPKILSSGPVARSLMASENLEQITFIGLIHLVRYNIRIITSRIK